MNYLTEAFKQGFKKEAMPPVVAENPGEEQILPEKEMDVGETSATGGLIGATGLPIAEKMGIYKRNMPGTNLPVAAVKGGIGGLALGTVGALGINALNDMQKNSMSKEASILDEVKRFIRGSGKNSENLKNVTTGSTLGEGTEGVAQTVKGEGDVLKEFKMPIGEAGPQARGAIMDEFDQTFPNVKAYDNSGIRMEQVSQEGIDSENLSDLHESLTASSKPDTSSRLVNGIVENKIGLKSDKGRAVVRDLVEDNIGKNSKGDTVIIDPIVDKVEGFYGARGAQGVFKDMVPAVKFPASIGVGLKKLNMDRLGETVHSGMKKLTEASRFGTAGAAGYGLYDLARGDNNGK